MTATCRVLPTCPGTAEHLRLVETTTQDLQPPAAVGCLRPDVLQNRQQSCRQMERQRWFLSLNIEKDIQQPLETGSLHLDQITSGRAERTSYQQTSPRDAAEAKTGQPKNVKTIITTTVTTDQ